MSDTIQLGDMLLEDANHVGMVTAIKKLPDGRTGYTVTWNSDTEDTYTSIYWLYEFKDRWAAASNKYKMYSKKKAP